MNEITEMYKDRSKESSARRASHREQSPQMLEGAGIPYQSKNGGAHLIVEGNTSFIDFWPGTGKWIERGTAVKGFGVRNLIKHIQGG